MNVLRALVALLVASSAVAQDLEPRRWTHLPVDTNVLGLGYLYTKGDIRFDPVLRIEGGNVEMHTTVLSYSRYFSLFDTTARLDVVVPYQFGEWRGVLDGAPAGVDREGFADPALRLSANLVGAPALRGKEFMAFQRENDVTTAVGVALETRLPLGEYDDDKLINLGQNRFAITPQLGVLHTRGPWSFEATGSVSFFTDNDDFFGDTKLEQDPVFAMQAHVVRVFDGGYWLGAGAAYGWAGGSTIDDIDKDDERRNLLVGASFGFRLSAAMGVRIAYVYSDARTENGSDTNAAFITWALLF